MNLTRFLVFTRLKTMRYKKKKKIGFRFYKFFLCWEESQKEEDDGYSYVV